MAAGPGRGPEVEVREGARVIARATADERGEWVVLPSEPLPGGQRALSVQAARPGAPPLTSEVVVLDLPATAAGTSVASAAAPGASAPRTAVTEQAVVEPGNSLWELARRRYGQGTAYGAIYQANRGLIRDPDLIYPGQVFVMPPGPWPRRRPAPPVTVRSVRDDGGSNGSTGERRSA